MLERQGEWGNSFYSTNFCWVRETSFWGPFRSRRRALCKLKFHRQCSPGLIQTLPSQLTHNRPSLIFLFLCFTCIWLTVFLTAEFTWLFHVCQPCKEPDDMKSRLSASCTLKVAIKSAFAELLLCLRNAWKKLNMWKPFGNWGDLEHIYTAVKCREVLWPRLHRKSV